MSGLLSIRGLPRSWHTADDHAARRDDRILYPCAKAKPEGRVGSYARRRERPGRNDRVLGRRRRRVDGGVQGDSPGCPREEAQCQVKRWWLTPIFSYGPSWESACVK